MTANSVDWVWPLTNENITFLPLSNPLCGNDTCIAYNISHIASQAQISWASQFEYGNYVAYFYCALIGIFAIAHVYRSMFAPGQSRTHSASTSPPSIITTLTAAIRSVSYRRLSGRTADWLGFPSFGVAAVLFLAIVFSVVLCFVERPFYRGSRGFGSPPLGVRAGLAATALTPVMVALGGKHNFITLLTGISHEKLNIFHRWGGYIYMFLALIHTIPFFVAALVDGGAARLAYQFYSMESQEYSGIAPLVILVFLTVFSLPVIRRRFYELFVHSHIIAFIAYLGTMFWHAQAALNSWDWLWATLAVWLLQLMTRALYKTTFFEMSSRKGVWRRSGTAFVTHLGDNMMMVSVQLRLHWRPSQHAFLRFPEVGMFDNHPFTITSVPDDKSTSASPTNNILTFLIRPYNGVTKALFDTTKPLEVMLDGPYGGLTNRLERQFDNVILVAGGGGVSAMLPWLSHLAPMIRAGSQRITGVHLIWCIRHESAIGWAMEQLQDAIKVCGDRADIQIYITGDATAVTTSGVEDQIPVKSLDVEKRAGESSRAARNLDGMVHRGRPDLKQTVSDALSPGRNMILGCGPESMKVDLSNAAAGLQSRVLKSTCSEVALHTETFGW
ncbi:hypothetical protein MBLNU457_5308t1 [Dothideomycetes sp. NU457]